MKELISYLTQTIEVPIWLYALSCMVVVTQGTMSLGKLLDRIFKKVIGG